MLFSHCVIFAAEMSLDMSINEEEVIAISLIWISELIAIVDLSLCLQIVYFNTVSLLNMLYCIIIMAS